MTTVREVGTRCESAVFMLSNYVIAWLGVKFGINFTSVVV